MRSSEGAVQQPQASQEPDVKGQNKAKQEGKAQPSEQHVSPLLPATAFMPVQPQLQPQLPAWTFDAGDPHQHAVPQPFAPVPQMPQAGLMPGAPHQQVGEAGKAPPAMHPGLLAQAALCSLQPQQNLSSTPSDGSYMGMGWWPAGMSMQNLLNLMVGSQMGSQMAS